MSRPPVLKSWIILAGEYPPEVGGVAAYTRKLAVALAAAGDDVRVWAPAPSGRLAHDPGFVANPLPDHLGPRSLLRLERELREHPEARVLVQYVPHSFGMKALNVPFCAWIAARTHDPWIMFHEVAVWRNFEGPRRENVMAIVTQAMARIVSRRAGRIFLSAEIWRGFLSEIGATGPEPEWLPVPSNLPEEVQADETLRLRSRFGLAPDDVTVATFGTFNPVATKLLHAVLGRLGEREASRTIVLIGKNSLEQANVCLARRPKARVVATGPLPADEVAALLAGSSLTVQPFNDGVCTRRGSVMAALGLGVPVVTNAGMSTEPVWRTNRPVALAASPSAAAIADEAEALLADPIARAELGARGRALYRSTFGMDRLLRVLREEPWERSHAEHAEVG